MEVAIHAVGNALRNLNFLVACPATGEALAVDPMDVEWIESTLESRGWMLRWIVNTHAHHDHVQGNLDLKASTQATIACHSGAKDQVPGASVGLSSGDVLRVGEIALTVLDTPGHTMTHVCLLQPNRALFSGDTLFNAGAGNCHHGGHPDALYETFSNLLAPLSDDVTLYPGHDYMERNLEFTLDREPGNDTARQRLAQLSADSGPQILTLGEEREINTFFRLDEEEISLRLGEALPGRPLQQARDRFLALRELRNRW